MQLITRKKKEINLEDFKKRSAVEEDFHELINVPSVIADEDTGEVICIYGKLPDEYAAFSDMLNQVEYHTTERTSGLKTTSRIFGAMPRIALRSDFCRTAGLKNENPRVHAMLESMALFAEGWYRVYAPERYQKHQDMVQKVIKDYRMNDTVFTSGIINKNNPLKYHFDSGNFDDVFSCMLGFKTDVLGGYLSFPEYDLALKIDDLSISLFDGQSILHGVTPITKLRETATRFTVVYYSLKGMWKCNPLNDELSRIRKLKTEREQKRRKKA